MRSFPLEQIFISFFIIFYVGGLIGAHPVYYNANFHC